MTTLMDARPDTDGLEIVRALSSAPGATRQQVTYRSGDLTISGVLTLPAGDGPFPAVVVNHGYLPPNIYRVGQGLEREERALAAAGFASLHTDYRGYGESDRGSMLSRESWLGYTQDAVNAVEALKRVPEVDSSRIGMIGRSMGGGVTMNVLVTHPGLVKAAVLYSSVSSQFDQNLRLFHYPEHRKFERLLAREVGTPETAPELYDGLSPRTYFDRVAVPTLLLHGTADDVCPPAWSATTNKQLKAEGLASDLVMVPGEGHVFTKRWMPAAQRMIDFFRANLE